MPDGDGLSVVRVENAAAAGPFVVVCEHASNRFPERFGTLGLTETERRAHIAWDPGAEGLARGLAQRLGAPLVLAEVSRLIYDLNRPPQAPGAMATSGETYRIPGNEGLDATARRARTEAIYLPFHARLRAELALRAASGSLPVLVTVHSFTPVWHGQTRAVELGVIHDADDRLARAVLAEAQRRTALRTALNAPYSAADGVTHTLALHATSCGLANVMLEIRNDLIATPEAQAAMAGQLAPVLCAALERIGDRAAGQARIAGAGGA